MAEEEVGLRLSLKNRREVAAGVHQVGGELDYVGDRAAAANRQSRLASRGFAAFGRAGRAAGRLAAVGFAAAASAVVAAGYATTKVLQASFAEAREAQKVSAVTRAEIKATGGVANVTARSMSRLAGAISRKAGIDDEAIQSGANLLLTFKNVRNEVGAGNDIFNQATQAAVDLSAAGFGSIESGSKMLGKALNDPIKGITALSRAGVTFSAQQVETIKGMVEQNDLLSAQKIILGEVKSQVGGVAAEQATWGDKAGVMLGNIEERLGTALLPLLDRVQHWFVQKGGPALDHWVGIFERRGIPTIEKYAGLFQDKGIPAIKDFIEDARPLARSILPAIGTGLNTARDAFRVIAPKMKTIFDGFNNLPDWAKSAIAIGAGSAVVANKLGAGNLLSGLASRSKPMPVIVMNQGFPGAPGAGPAGAGGAAGAAGAGAATTAARGGRLAGIGSKVLRSPLVRGLGWASAFIPAPDFYDMSVADDPMTKAGIKDVDDLEAHNARIDAENNYRAELERTAALFKTLPRDIQTHVAINGGPESRREAIDLAKTYDLTKAERVTLFRASGIGLTQREVANLIGLYDNARKPVVTPVRLDGIGTAEARIASYQSKLQQLANFGVMGPTARAGGGPVKAGHPYVVGERRPELFVPKVDGFIHPKVPDMPRFDDEDWGRGAGSSEPVVVQVVLDRKVLAEATFDYARDRLARS